MAYVETLAGRDSGSIKEMVTEESSKVDWARLLLDESTDDVIITVSREKIAHEIIKLRSENAQLKQQTSHTGTFDAYASTDLQSS